MFDFEIQRCTRKCAKSEREIEAGEYFYSVLVSEGSEVVRYDYSQQGWEGPPEETVGWWKSQMPASNTKRANWAPNDVMLDYFQQLEPQPEKADIRYILTLLMIRRRIMRLEESESDEEGRELLVVFCSRNDTEYRVPVISPDAKRAKEIQDELMRLLFADAA